MDDAAVSTLRPVTDQDAALLAQWRAEPVSSSFDDFSATAGDREQYERLPPPSGIETMLVLDAAQLPIGNVQWHPVRHGPTRGSVALNIGISLRPEARGRGHGARAQRQLTHYLFDRYPVHRVEAGTDIDNIAEQRALDRAGFRREGIARGAQWRAGGWRDLVIYSKLRRDEG